MVVRAVMLLVRWRWSDAVLSYDVHVIPNVTVSATPEFICEGDEAVLTATGADTYVWTSGDEGATVTLGEGVYMVTGTTEAGCSATSSYVVQVPTFTAGAIQSDEITICASQTIPVNIASLTDGVSGGNTGYRWLCNGQVIDGSDMSSYTVTVAEMTAHNGGDFTYTREYLNGCTGSWEASAGSYIIHQTPAVSLTVAGNTQVECGTGTTLTASGFTGNNVIYNWYADENCTQLLHTGATFNVDNVTEDVTYYVQAGDYESVQIDPTIVMLGASPSSTSEYAPTRTSSAYSLVETIVGTEDITSPCDILSVAYYATSAGTRNLDIYMMPVAPIPLHLIIKVVPVAVPRILLPAAACCHRWRTISRMC